MSNISEETEFIIAAGSAIDLKRYSLLDQLIDGREYYCYLAAECAMFKENFDSLLYLLRKPNVKVDWQDYRLVRNLSQFNSGPIAKLLLVFAIAQTRTVARRKELFDVVGFTYNVARLGGHIDTSRVLMREILAQQGYGMPMVVQQPASDPQITADGMPLKRRSGRKRIAARITELCTCCDRYHAVDDLCAVLRR